MSSHDDSTFPIEQVHSALGSLSCPGSLDDFAYSLTQPFRNVMRCRRGINSSELAIATTPIPWYSLGRRPVDETKSPSRTIAYACGDFFVQDAGSLLALAVAGADGDDLRGKLVCDLCAAPGGKASALVEAVSNQDTTGEGFVLANEVIRTRIGALQLNLARTGSDQFAISNLDPETLAQRLPGLFDLVVVDAPCSGQAMLGRGKQNTSSLSEHQIRHSASRQRRILDAAVCLVREGGRLVYSTCTFAEAENESQIQRLIDHGVATPHSVDALGDYESNPGCYRCWPHVHHCAGSFAAAVTIHHASPPTARKPRSRKHQLSKPKKAPVDLAAWYDGVEKPSRICVRDAVVLGFPEKAPGWVDELAISGPEILHRAGQTWKPAHAGALRRHGSLMPSTTIQVDERACRQFMRGEPIDCRASGWNAIQLNGRPLGWIKANGKLGKNHLPTAARMTGELVS